MPVSDARGFVAGRGVALWIGLPIAQDRWYHRTTQCKNIQPVCLENLAFEDEMCCKNPSGVVNGTGSGDVTSKLD